MIQLPAKWGKYLRYQPETGMGYWVVTVRLMDGRSYERAVVVDSGHLTKIRGRTDIPFKADDIAELLVTHDKWDFGSDE